MIGDPPLSAGAANRKMWPEVAFAVDSARGESGAVAAVAKS